MEIDLRAIKYFQESRENGYHHVKNKISSNTKRGNMNLLSHKYFRGKYEGTEGVVGNIDRKS